ncbi:MAG TPA: protein-glutamate O-methyltransferase CheR [Gammaproteobacteria bacterium]|nr:protein-glutamate O-methyltransferase CheR [Gammaproteobacteria bacterium]
MRDLFWQLITDEEYQELKKLIESAIGVNLNLNRRDFIENLLLKRFKDLDISDFKTYYEFIKNNEQEMTCLINLVTNVSTNFFREKHHFEYMEKYIFPMLIASKRRIRLWSAGCSTGEEPYSIAMTLFETVENISAYDVKILATDINTRALEIARSGIYNKNRFENLSHYTKNLPVIEGDNVKKIQINKAIREIISFRKLNLLDRWPMKKLFDIIFCRNVTIYLKPEVTAQLFKQFDKLLEPGGFLILGHSESLTLFSDRYICLGKTIYKKVC